MNATTGRKSAAIGAIEEAAARLGELALRDAPLGARTTYRVGGNAALLTVVEDDEGIGAVIDAVSCCGIDVLVVGKGSNLLVSDAGFFGLAVVLGERFAAIDLAGRPIIEAGGAAGYQDLARSTAAAGLSGMEWAVGVPGSVGGAVRMNAGGHGHETADRLVEARLVDFRLGSDRRVPAADLDLSYRRSVVTSDEAVVSARFVLEEDSAEACSARVAEIVSWRRANQPGGRNAGSIFQNPPGDAAGRLIEEAGAKGLRVGSAEVSSKHANFIQADRDGSAEDVRVLIEQVRALVGERLGVELRTEVVFVGFDR